MTLGERLQKMPEDFKTVPLSLATDYPDLLSVWLRPCPFCNLELSNRLIDMLQCGRSHGKTYKELGEWVDEQLRRLDAPSHTDPVPKPDLGRVPIEPAPGSEQDTAAIREGGEE